VLRGLRAHFNQPSAPSRPGTDWAISLTNSAGERRILVRTYAEDVGGLSQEQEAQLAVEYVGQLIQSGWSPDQYRGEPGELVVPKRAGAVVKCSWFQRLFGRPPGG
jgi:hypothetical protein